MNILICGHRSYAARNFKDLLEERGHKVWCFSRGDVHEKDHIVTGPVQEMNSNPFLKDISIDVVVNFIILDGQSVEENLKYIDALCKWCEQSGVKRIVHMSSISVLPNSAKLINEDTPIDSHPELKGGYGALKIAVDYRLLQWEKVSNTQVVLIRPGFITAKDKKNALAGIAKLLPCNFAILMGNSKSTLPIVSREKLHQGILNAIESESPLSIYLMVDDGINTKKAYLRSFAPHAKIISLPKGIVFGIAKLLKVVGVFDERKVQMVKGQFKFQQFNAEKTSKQIGK